MSTQLGATKIGMIPLTVYMNAELLDLQAKNSDNSYFNVAKSGLTKDSLQIGQEQIALSFPDSQADQDDPYKTKIITDVRGIQGPEVGTPNIKEVCQNLTDRGIDGPIVDRAANYMLLRRAKFMGMTTGSAAYSQDPNLKSRKNTIGIMIQGQCGYTNICQERHRVGDVLMVDLATETELNGLDWRKAQFRGGAKPGTWPAIYRKYRVRDAATQATEEIVNYLNNPSIFRNMYRSTCRADVAHMANVSNVVRFTLYNAIRGYGLINQLLGLTPVPIETFNPNTHLLRGGPDRKPAPNKDVQGRKFGIEKNGSRPFAELTRALYRLPNSKAMPDDGASTIGILRATEATTVETILAVVTGLIDGSGTLTSDRTNMFAGIAAAKLRSDRRQADASVSKDPLPGSFLESAQDFTEALLKGIMYGVNMKHGIQSRDSRVAFGNVQGIDGRKIRNLSMTTGGRGRIQSPDPATEFGQMARLQQIMPTQGLTAMAEMIEDRRRMIAGVATRNQGHLGAGAILLTHGNM